MKNAFKLVYVCAQVDANKCLIIGCHKVIKKTFTKYITDFLKASLLDKIKRLVDCKSIKHKAC